MLTSLEIDGDIVKKRLQSVDLIEFTNLIKTTLNITSEEYVTEYVYEYAVVDCEGFQEPEIKAGFGIETRKLNFFVKSIAQDFNLVFGHRIHDWQTFYRILDVILKLYIVHELIHIQQIQQGTLTLEVKRNFERTTPYLQRPYEIEAHDRSEEIIAALGEFETEVLKYVRARSPEILVNDSGLQLERLCKSLNYPEINI
ncbi:hypothetical protein [Brevibacillus sp. SYSU BS000544]|uniref:hypothetical protein n=1 Tax=Brevibacillus sp. SYSU BS000544 TaxID=3416443 RepID=UPI003CE54426